MNLDICFSPCKRLPHDGDMTMGIGVHAVTGARHWLGRKHPATVAAGACNCFRDERDTPDAVSFIRNGVSACSPSPPSRE